MAEWKKIITSGSHAELASVTASLNGSGNDITFSDTAMAVGDSLVFVDAGGGTKKDTVADIVTLLAGDGLQNDSNKFAIDASEIAGNGIQASGENLQVNPSQTTITSILAADLVLGEDAQTKIDFETANEIHFDINNTELFNMTGNQLSGSAVSTGSFGHLVVGGGEFSSASLAAAIANDGDITGVTAGNGLTGGGTSGGVSLAVGAGDGITVNSGDVAITAAQTTITSVLATDLKIGEDAQTAIDFETPNEIHFDVNNTELLNLTGNLISGSAVSTGSFGHLVVGGGEFSSASLAAAIANDGDITGVTAGNGLTGGGTSGGVSLAVGAGTGITVNSGDVQVTAAQTGITSVFNSSLKIGHGDSHGNIDFSSDNNIIFDIDGTQQVKITDGTFEPITDSDIDLGGSSKYFKDAYIDTITTTGAVTIGGDLTVNGTTTVVSSSNLEVGDRFILLNSGSNSGDGGIIVQHGTTASGSGYGYDVSANRWGFTKSGSMGKNATSIATEAFVSAVVTDDNEAEFRKNGNIRVQGGEIFIYVE